MLRLTSVFLCATIILVGCQSTDKSEKKFKRKSSGDWGKYYDVIYEDQRPETYESKIIFEQVDYDLLAQNRESEGYVVLGMSTFRDKLAKRTPGGPKSKLRRQASYVGADYVRWAERLIGSKGSFKGNRNWSKGRIDIVADYLAVYYGLPRTAERQ